MTAPAPLPPTVADSLAAALWFFIGQFFPWGLLATGMLFIFLLFIDVYIEPLGFSVVEWVYLQMTKRGSLYSGKATHQIEVRLPNQTFTMGDYQLHPGFRKYEFHDGGPDLVARACSLYDKFGQEALVVKDVDRELSYTIECVDKHKVGVITLRTDETARFAIEHDYMADQNRQLLSQLTKANERPLNLMLEMANSLGQVKDKMGWKQASFPLNPSKMSAGQMEQMRQGGDE